MDNSAFLTMSALSLLCLTMFFLFFFFFLNIQKLLAVWISTHKMHL